MSSIKDVARLAGVSFTTVSHVINGTRKVSDTARQNVLVAMRESGYVPSHVARSLRVAQTRAIGVLVPDISNPFCSEITLGAEQAADQAGYAVVLGNARLTQAHQAQQIESLVARRVDGLLLVAGVLDHAQLQESLRGVLAARAMPILLIDHDLESADVDVFQSDSLHAGWLATKHLTDLGHRRIACISGPQSLRISEERVEGWRKALSEVGEVACHDWVYAGDFGIESGHMLAARILGQQSFTAVLACNDMMALGVLRAAAARGIQVPTQCSVVGIDGIDFGRYSFPALTTVGASLRVVGERAVQMLIERMHEPKGVVSRRVWREFQLINRESTAVVPT